VAVNQGRPPPFAIDPSGTWLAYLGAPQTIGGHQFASLIVEKSDYSASRTLTTLQIDGCYPQFEFLGVRLVASNGCELPITSFDSASGASVVIAPSSDYSWYGDPSGTWIVVPSQTMNSFATAVYPVAGGQAVISWPALVQSISFSSDGQSAFYYDPFAQQLTRLDLATGQLRRFPSAEESKNPLPNMYFFEGCVVSRDVRWILCGLNAGTNGFTSYFLHHADQDAPSIASNGIWSQYWDDVSSGFFPTFTDDSSFFIEAWAVDGPLGNDNTGIAGIGPLPAAQNQPLLSFTVDNESPSYFYLTAGGGRLVFTNPVPVMPNQKTCAIEFVDFAQPCTPPVQIAAPASCSFALSPDKKQVVYSVPNDGVYVAPLP
jgi:hypothetical protein